MGDESAVSGMSEVSTADQSKGQAAAPGGKGKGMLILIIGALLVAGAVAVFFVSQRGSAAAGSTEEDANAPPASPGGGPPAGPPAVPGGEPTTVAPPRPKLLLCTTKMPGTKNDPPSGLCDIVVYDAGSADLGSTAPANVVAFLDLCKKAHTRCGLNIDSDMKVLTKQLDTDPTKKVMKDFYAAGIKNYGLLRSEIKASSKADDLKVQSGLLKKLESFMKVTGDDRDILFWGVSPLLEGAASPPDSMVQVFMQVLKSASINMLVYQTTYAANSSASKPSCLSTGPAMWTSAPLPLQPTFLDALNFRKAVQAQLDPGVAEMLAFMLCGYWTQYSKKDAKPEFGFKTDCKRASISAVEDFVCTGAPKVTSYQPAVLVKDSMQYVTTSTSKEWVVGFDMKDTLLQKMCMASLDKGFDGGWVVHNLECHFKEHCSGKDEGGFPRVRAINESMRQPFTKCDYAH